MNKRQLNDVTIVLASVRNKHASTQVFRYDFQGDAEDLKMILDAFPKLFVEGGQMKNQET